MVRRSEGTEKLNDWERSTGERRKLIEELKEKGRGCYWKI
jgi:hypothetical protein